MPLHPSNWSNFDDNPPLADVSLTTHRFPNIRQIIFGGRFYRWVEISLRYVRKFEYKENYQRCGYDGFLKVNKTNKLVELPNCVAVATQRHTQE